MKQSWRLKRKQDKYDTKLLKYRIKEEYKADKREIKSARPSLWQNTMTKKVVWISVIMTIILWLIDVLFIFLSSPNLLYIPETTVNEFTDACKNVTVGLFATIVFYFIRAFMDKWNISHTGLIGDGKQTVATTTATTQTESIENMISEMHDRISQS